MWKKILIIVLVSIAILNSGCLGGEGSVITIISPNNITYSIETIALKVSSDNPVQAWEYSINSGPKTQFSPNTTIEVEEGHHHITVYAKGSEGKTTSASVYFTVAPSRHVTIKLQDPGTDVDDAWVDENDPNWVFNPSELKVSFQSFGVDRSYIKFNISSIPKNEQVLRAQLFLYKTADVFLYEGGNLTPQMISVHHVYNNSWSEESLNFTVQPCGYEFNLSVNCNLVPSDTVAVNGSEGVWWSWDVTDMVKSEHNAGNEVISMALKGEDEREDLNIGSYFASKEYIKPNLRPYLLITHTDSVPPAVVITSPRHETYNTASLDLEYSIDEAYLDWTGYSLDGLHNVTTIGEIKTFDEGSVAKNVTFADAGSDASTYIKVPKNATVIRATMLASGYDSWSEYNSKASSYSYLSVSNPDVIDDQNFSTYTTGNISGAYGIIYENYSVPPGTIEIDYIFKVRDMDVGPGQKVFVEVYSYSPEWGWRWKEKWVSGKKEGIKTKNITKTAWYFVNEDDVVQIRINLPTYNPESNKYDAFYEGKFRYRGYPANIALDTGSDSTIDWTSKEYENLKPENSPQKIDLNTTAINDYIHSNDADEEGYVHVPLLLFSDSTGVVELSSLSVDYYSKAALNLRDGTHDVTVYAIDKGGNIGSDTVSFEIDTG